MTKICLVRPNLILKWEHTFLTFEGTKSMWTCFPHWPPQHAETQSHTQYIYIIYSLYNWIDKKWNSANVALVLFIRACLRSHVGVSVINMLLPLLDRSFLCLAFAAVSAVRLRNMVAATTSLRFTEEAWQRAAGVRPLKKHVNTRCWNVVDASHDTVAKHCMKIVFVNNSITVSWFRHMGHSLTLVCHGLSIEWHFWECVKRLRVFVQSAS